MTEKTTSLLSTLIGAVAEVAAVEASPDPQVIIAAAKQLAESPMPRRPVLGSTVTTVAEAEARLQALNDWRIAVDRETVARVATLEDAARLGWARGEAAAAAVRRLARMAAADETEARQLRDELVSRDYAARLSRYRALGAEPRRPKASEMGIGEGLQWSTAVLGDAQVWSNGHILDTSVPKGYRMKGVETRQSRRSARRFIPKRYGMAMTVLGIEDGLDGPSRAVLTWDSKATVVVNEAYLEYFRSKYPDAVFRTDRWDRTDRVHVFAGGEWVGIIMAADVPTMPAERFRSLVAEAEAARARHKKLLTLGVGSRFKK